VKNPWGAVWQSLDRLWAGHRRERQHSKDLDRDMARLEARIHALETRMSRARIPKVSDDPPSNASATGAVPPEATYAEGETAPRPRRTLPSGSYASLEAALQAMENGR